MYTQELKPHGHMVASGEWKMMVAYHQSGVKSIVIWSPVGTEKKMFIWSPMETEKHGHLVTSGD